MLEGSPEFLNLSQAAHCAVRLHIYEFDSRILCSDVDGSDRTVCSQRTYFHSVALEHGERIRFLSLLCKHYGGHVYCKYGGFRHRCLLFAERCSSSYYSCKNKCYDSAEKQKTGQSRKRHLDKILHVISNFGAKIQFHPQFAPILRTKFQDYENLCGFCIFAGWYEECPCKDIRIDAGHMVLVECHRF